MYVLLVTRKGVLEETLASRADENLGNAVEAIDALKDRANQMDGHLLEWTELYGEWGAHSVDDEEKTYEIVETKMI